MIVFNALCGMDSFTTQSNLRDFNNKPKTFRPRFEWHANKSNNGNIITVIMYLCVFSSMETKILCFLYVPGICYFINNNVFNKNI